MIIRKVFLFIGCLLSVIGLLTPMYSLKLNGVTVEDGNVLLIKSFYGIIILLADILIVGFAIFKIKKGYVISSLVSVGATLYSVVYSSITEVGAWGLLKSTGNMMSSLTNQRFDYSLEEGPAYVLLILAAVVILLTMIWNALNNDE